MYVLEHGFQWLTGGIPHFWSGGFFYPTNDLVIAYSDHHIGNLPIYIVLRLLRLDRETAFQLLIIIICFLNYGVSWWVLRKIRLVKQLV